MLWCTIFPWGFWVWGKDNINKVVFKEELVSLPNVGIDDIQAPIIPYFTIELIIELENNELIIESKVVQTQWPQEVPLRRSSREKRRTISDDYIVFFQEHQDNMGIMEDDPINFQQALQSSNSQNWINTMEEEIKSMKDNVIWKLVELPLEVKPIGWKLIFKIERDSQGKIERHKVLVARVFLLKRKKLITNRLSL